MALWNERVFVEQTVPIEVDVPAGQDVEPGFVLHPERHVLEVYLNGQRLPKESWTITGGTTLRFDFDLKAGDQVTYVRQIIW